MSWRACAHCHRECHCHSVSPSHIAKGPEIEPRHRLVPAVGIMRLVAGQARLLRQWSFACIGGTNVWFVCVVCVAGGMAWLRYASGTPMCLCVGFTSL